MNRNILHRGLLIITILFLYLGAVSNTALSKSIFCSDTPMSSIQDTSLHIIISKDVLPLFTYTDLSDPNADVSAINSEIQSLDTNTTLQTLRTYSISTGEQRNIYLDITVKSDTVLLYTLADTTGWVINNADNKQKRKFKEVEPNKLKSVYDASGNATLKAVYAYRDIDTEGKDIEKVKVSFKLTDRNNMDYVKIYVLPNPSEISTIDLDDPVAMLDSIRKFVIKNGESWHFADVESKEVIAEISNKEAIRQYNQAGGVRFFIVDIPRNTSGISQDIILENLQIKAKLRGKFEQEITSTICGGGAFTLPKKRYKTSGDYVYTNLDANSTIDTLITLHLNVINAIDTVIHLNYCKDINNSYVYDYIDQLGNKHFESFSINGSDTTINRSYSLVDTLSCTDEVTYRIKIIGEVDTIEASICQGEKYVFGDTTLSLEGTYTRAIETINGCNSLVTLKLNINSVQSDTIVTTICEGDKYDFEGENCTIEDIYTKTFKTIGGCDSTKVLDLRVNPIYKDIVTASICQGSTYTFENKEYTKSGTYADTLETINGCDSIKVLKLNVNPIYSDITTVAICEGKKYTFAGTKYDKAGIYTDTLQTINGCDSVSILNLIVNPTYKCTITASICKGDTYSFGGKDYTPKKATSYTKTFEAKLTGCDSTVTAYVTVLPIYTVKDTVTICQDSIYSFGDTILSTAGTYTRTLKTVNGCDSVVTLKLNINPTYKIDDAEITICQDSIYSFGDTVLATAGTYTRTLKTVNGCDSVVTLRLEVSPTYSDSIELAICEGDTFVFGTQSLTKVGTYTETFKTITGCDSIVTLKLNINPTYKIDTTITICEGATYMFGDTILKTSGIYTKTFQTIDGCDSIRVLELIVNPIYKDTIVETICEGEAYIFGTQALTTKGVYTTTFQTTEGCDSVITLMLNVNPTYTKTDTVVICEGETYTFGTQTITKAAEYKETFKTENNCDSLVILTLIVNPKLDTSITKVICEGETYIFDTQALTTAGIYTKTFQSKITGCDSTVTLNLIVNPKLDTSITASICTGETYIFGTQTLKTTGIYTETFQSEITGCDSIVTLALTVNPEVSTSIEKIICEGEIYAFGTQELKTTGTYTEVFQSEITGCDSIVTLTLNVNRVIDTTIDLRYCRVENNTYSYEYTDQLGDIHTENFVIYNADTTIDKEYKSSNELACKEYVTYNITIIEKRVDTIEAIICKGDRYQENGFDISTAGYYTHYGKTVDDCDSLLTIHLIVEENYDTTIYAEICEGEVYEFIGSEYDRTGRYTKILRSENGCDSVVTLLLTVYPSYYDTIYETLQTNEVYNKDGIYAFESGKYTKRMTTEKGCDSILILDLTIESPIVVYVPNVIQVGQGGISSGPTGDGDNSKLRYFVEDDRFEFVDFRVYNRDGIVVWQARDSQDYWDGKFKGDYCPQGVYVYVLRYLNKSNNQPKYTQGTLMLYR